MDRDHQRWLENTKVSTSSPELQRRPPKSSRRATKERTADAAAPVAMTRGKHYSPTINEWAAPCRFWLDKGCCFRGVACRYRHEGFPTHGDNGSLVRRCIICGRTSHTSKVCTCPGGSRDPKKTEVWKAYQTRKDKELARLFGTNDNKGQAKRKGREAKVRPSTQSDYGDA